MFNSGDTVGGKVIQKNRVRIDFQGDIIQFDKDEMEGLKIGDRVTLTFGGPGRVMKVEKEDDFGGVF